MTLFFGWYSFLLRTFTPQQLGIDDPAARDLTFEVREKCAHIFFIPCFSLGKMYVTRRHDQKYELPAQYVSSIVALGPYKTPWYCFTLPILLVLASVGISINSKIAESARKKLQKQQFETKFNNIAAELPQLTSNHFIKLKSPLYHYSRYDHYLKVDTLQGDEISCLLFLYDSPNSQLNTYDLWSTFQTQESNLDSIQISRAELNKCIPLDYETYEKGEMYAADLFGNDTLYYIDAMIDPRGPYLTSGSSSQGPNRIEFLLTNYGFGAELTRIETLEGKISWSGGEPVYLPGGGTRGNRMYIKGSGATRDMPYKILLHFKDSADVSYTYSITGKNLDKELRRETGILK